MLCGGAAAASSCCSPVKGALDPHGCSRCRQAASLPAGPDLDAVTAARCAARIACMAAAGKPLLRMVLTTPTHCVDRRRLRATALVAVLRCAARSLQADVRQGTLPVRYPVQALQKHVEPCACRERSTWRRAAAAAASGAVSCWAGGRPCWASTGCGKQKRCTGCWR
jgi:hypothetical protein